MGTSFSALAVAAALTIPGAMTAQGTFDRSAPLPTRAPIAREAEVKMARAAAPAPESVRHHGVTVGRRP